jgi:integrase
MPYNSLLGSCLGVARREGKGMPGLTKRAVDAARPGTIVWDDEVKGFGLRVRPSRTRTHTKTYLLKVPTGRRGRARWLTIGRHGSPWTVEAAREEAKRLLGRIANGDDPAAARAKAKGLPTLAEFAGRYLAEYAKPHKAPRSVREDERMLSRVIVPRLGQLRVDQVQTPDVAALHHARRSTPTDANRALALVSKMMSLAETWGLRPKGASPCRGIPRFKEGRRERFLSEAELARLGLVLREAEDEAPFAVAAVKLLVFTGARCSEVLNARWSDVDLDAGTLRVANPKEGRPKTIRLGPPALKVLSELPQLKGNPFVIVGDKEGQPLVGLGHVWSGYNAPRRGEDGKPERVHVAGIRDKARLPDVRLHDLRHSWASVAAGGGASLPVIGALLGHRQPGTTARYAHLGTDPLRKAADTVSTRIASAMSATPTKAAASMLGRRRR